MRGVGFEPAAFEDLAWWIDTDRAQAAKIVRLIREAARDPFSGTGKPEPLKHQLSGCWSRRINSADRLVYQVLPDSIRVISCRFHY